MWTEIAVQFFKSQTTGLRYSQITKIWHHCSCLNVEFSKSALLKILHLNGHNSFFTCEVFQKEEVNIGNVLLLFGGTLPLLTSASSRDVWHGPLLWAVETLSGGRTPPACVVLLGLLFPQHNKTPVPLVKPARPLGNKGQFKTRDMGYGPQQSQKRKYTYYRKREL